MIRVMQIIPTLVKGGAEKQMTLLAAGLPRDEFETRVCVLTADGPYRQQLEDAGIQVELVNKRYKLDPLALRRTRQKIREFQPDIVHTWIFAANCYGRQAAFAERVKHVVAGERCVDRWKAWHELAIDRHLARRTEQIVTNSTGVRDFYVQHGLPADKFTIIPNGILPRNDAGEHPPASLRSELGLPNDARLVGAVGRLWPQKRYKDLVWAAELLKAARDDAHFVIVGEGPQRRILESFIRNVQVGDRVHLLGQRTDVPDLLSQLDCFWLGSGYEGQSNALMEAMQAGVPVVASDIPGNRDLVEHQQSGFLVPLGDAAEFARATRRILDQPELAAQIATAAQQRMHEHFSVERMVEAYRSFYHELCESQPNSPK